MPVLFCVSDNPFQSCLTELLQIGNFIHTYKRVFLDYRTVTSSSACVSYVTVHALSIIVTTYHLQSSHMFATFYKMQVFITTY